MDMATSGSADEGKRQFNVLLPASLIREIKLASIDRGISLSAFVEQAVQHYLGKEK